MNLNHFCTILLIMMLACGPKVSPTAAPPAPPDDGPSLAPVSAIDNLHSLDCTPDACRLYTTDAVYQLELPSMSLTRSEDEPVTAPDVWPEQLTPASLADGWNARTKNNWRSPFQATIPSPDGGVFKLHRSTTPGTSRIARIGGHVMTARQGLDPNSPAYPWTLALHPTGTEAYHIVWSNPDLIAFNTRTLQTSWRIRLSGPAVGLFVSADGRYLVAELDAVAPDEQLLDYGPAQRQPPAGTEPFGDGAWTGIDRPSAKTSAVIDLNLGQAVAEVPGRFVGFYTFRDGAVLAGTGGVARVEWSGD